MKKTFLVSWALLSLLLIGLVLRELWVDPSFASVFALGMAGYYSFCFFKLILAAYMPWGLLGSYRRAGYWLYLILLPMTLIPLHSAYEVWVRGAYVAAQTSRRTAVLQQVLGWLQDAIGYLGPLLALGAFGLCMAVVLLRLLRGQVAR